MRKLFAYLMIAVMVILILPAGVLAQTLEIDPEAEQAFKAAYAADNDYGPEELSLRYFGQYEGCHVAFVDGPFQFPTIEWSEVVAGFEFSYSSGQRLTVFRDSEVATLEDAFEAGWLSADAVAQLHANYTAARNPKTGDGVMLPLAMLMVSVLGLSVLTWRKKADRRDRYAESLFVRFGADALCIAERMCSAGL